MRVTVCGASGFLGSHVADALSAKGHAVTVFDTRSSKWLSDDQRQVFGDLRDPAQVRLAVRGADAVINCAAVAHVSEARHDPRRTIEVNVIGHLTALEASLVEGAKHMIYTSSMYAYSRHGSFYSASKRAAEELTELFGERGLPFTICRLGSLYGERSDERNPNTIYRLVKQAIETGEMRYDGRGGDLREFVNVKDVAAIMADLVKSPGARNERLVITGHQPMTILNLMEMIREIIGAPIKITISDKDYEGHYQTTPYAYRPSDGLKVIPARHVDLGEGILEVLHEISSKIAGR